VLGGVRGGCFWEGEGEGERYLQQPVLEEVIS
jgi:hypothetical protein